MPDRTADRRSSRGFHAVLVVLGAFLGIAAVCLIVFGTSSPRQLLVGIILGLWAALLAAFGLPGIRRPTAEPNVLAADLDALQAELSALADTTLQATEVGLKATQDSIASQGQDFRRMSELHAARETAARREADLSLQLAIRNEIERTVADQVGSLRAEVSSLRAEVVDRLDGQIKLERIEITRVIGSDLEALQNEVRRLATQREAADSGNRAAQAYVAQPAAGATVADHPGAQPDPDEIVDAELVEAKSSEAKSPAAKTVSERIAVPAAEAASSSQAWGPVRAVVAKAPAATSSPFGPDPLSPEPLSPEPLSPEPLSPEPLSPEPSPVPPLPVPPVPSQPKPFEPKPFEPKPFEPKPFEPKPLGRVPDPEPPPLEPPLDRVSSFLSGGDVFANLPRLTPISPDLLGLSGKRRAPEADPSSPKYVGRRRPDDAGYESDAVDDEPKPPVIGPEDSTSGGRGSGRRRAPGHASE